MDVALITAPTSEPITADELKTHLRLDDDAFNAEASLLDDQIKTSRYFVENFTRRALFTQTHDYYLQAWPNEDSFKLPFGNLQSVSYIKWKDTDGVETNLTKTITAFAASAISPTTKTKVTSSAHGFSDNDNVFIGGTTNYNGSWVISNATTNTFDITKVYVANDATGTANIYYIVQTNGERCGSVVLPYGESWPSGTLYTSNPIVCRFIVGWSAVSSIPSTIKTAVKMIASKLYENRGEDVLGQTIAEDKFYMNLLNSYRLWDEFQ